MSKKVSRPSNGVTNRPMTVAREEAPPHRLAPMPKQDEWKQPRAQTAMSMSFDVGKTTRRAHALEMRASMPDMGARGKEERQGRTRSVSVAGCEDTRIYSGKQGKPQNLSNELRVIQRALHEGGGQQFGRVQQLFFRGNPPGVAASAGGGDKKGGSPPKTAGAPSADRQQLSQAIREGLNIEASPQVIDEMMQLCSRGEESGRVRYKDFARVMWSDDVHHQLQTPEPEFTIGAKSEMRPLRHLFLPLKSAGFYNDNIQPRATIFGVKKGYSSVRYDMFSNGPRDRSNILSQVDPRVLQAVESSMGFERLPSRHHVTMRPLDPYLAYLTVGQGRRDVHPSPNPLNVLTSKPRTDVTLAQEWYAQPTMTFAFSHTQSGQTKGKPKNRLC